MGNTVGQTALFVVELDNLMIILSIDTATDGVSVAIADSTRVLASSEMRSEKQHAEVLTTMIDFVRKQAGVSFGDVGAVAVDIGPGLFTGMRVGIASAKAIAQVLDVPIIGVTSLDILATAVGVTDDVIACVIDARRGEVYWSLYRHIDGKLRQVTTPQASTVEECALQTIDQHFLWATARCVTAMKSIWWWLEFYRALSLLTRWLHCLRLLCLPRLRTSGLCAKSGKRPTR
jgi:tRNA threonylcarbamoyl adenosine modification protein YeaZ